MRPHLSLALIHALVHRQQSLLQSPLSRNRSFGEVLGKTGSITKARAQIVKTVEGVYSAGAMLELAHRVGVEAPIIEVVSDVVAGTLNPKDAVDRLMKVSIKADI